MSESRLGDLALYENILSSKLTKIATRLEVFPYAEVIGWILLKIEMVGMIIKDEEGNPVASFAPSFISKALQSTRSKNKCDHRLGQEH